VAPAAGNLEFLTGLMVSQYCRGSVGSEANGHTTVVSLQGGTHRSAGIGSIGIVPIGHVAY
jgi:hypothetical protein